MKLTLSLLGREVMAVEYRDAARPVPPVAAPVVRGGEDITAVDVADTDLGGEVLVDPAVPFGFASDALAVPSTVLQPPEDEEDDQCRRASRPIGFSAGS